MNILIADDEVDILEIIEFIIHDNFPKKVEVFLSKNAIEAIELLKKNEIDLCISDHNMPGGNGNEILKYIISNNLKTNFILCSTVFPKDMPTQYPVSNVYFHIQKPDIIQGIKKLVEFMKENSHLEINPTTIENDYIPVTLQLLELLGISPADLYIRIAENKYVKCLNENTPFTAEDNAKYVNKSLTKLYIKKPSDEKLITSLITSTITKLMLKKNMPISEKMIVVHTQLCDLIKFTGMTEELAATTKQNINQTTAIIMKDDMLNDFWKNLNLMGEYPSQLYTLQAMLASTIVKKLSWSSEATMFKLTLAAFLQDISLTNLSLMKIYDHGHFLKIQDTLRDKDINSFLEHPLKANDIIKGLTEIPPDIDKIVLEQHEMPDGSGFPRKLNSNQLGPLSCLFILSGLMARFILSEGTDFEVKKFVEKFEPLGYSKGNFKDSFNVIKNMQ